MTRRDHGWAMLVLCISAFFLAFKSFYALFLCSLLQQLSFYSTFPTNYIPSTDSYLLNKKIHQFATMFWMYVNQMRATRWKKSGKIIPLATFLINSNELLLTFYLSANKTNICSIFSPVRLDTLKPTNLLSLPVSQYIVAVYKRFDIAAPYTVENKAASASTDSSETGALFASSVLATSKQSNDTASVLMRLLLLGALNSNIRLAIGVKRCLF